MSFEVQVKWTPSLDAHFNVPLPVGTDLKRASTTASLSYIVPSLCDTTPTTTTPAPTAGGPTTPTGGGDQVGLLLISKFVQPESTDLVDFYNHYSLLASLEDLFGLKHLGYADVASLPRFDSDTYNGATSP